MQEKQTGTDSIRTGNAPSASLDPWPIPKEQITAPEPQAFGRFLWQSEDKCLGERRLDLHPWIVHLGVHLG